jgi:ubiquinone/menaquinone biosynthesis C-methylase UbiE
VFRRVNKLAETQDMHQLAYRSMIRNLIKMRSIIEKTKLPFSSHMAEHWLRLWEYSWAIIESCVDTRMHILDAGGTGTLLSYFLAMEGCRKVTTIDIDELKVEDAIRLSRHLGLNNIEHVHCSILDMPFADSNFDCVFSICVIEHISRGEQPSALAQLSRVLKPGGRLAMTFDYVQGCEELSPDGFCSPEDVHDRLIVPAVDCGFFLEGDYNYVTRSLEDLTRDDRRPVTYGSLLFSKQGELKLQYKPFA